MIVLFFCLVLIDISIAQTLINSYDIFVGIHADNTQALGSVITKKFLSERLGNNHVSFKSAYVTTEPGHGELSWKATQDSTRTNVQTRTLLSMTDETASIWYADEWDFPPFVEDPTIETCSKSNVFDSFEIYLTNASNPLQVLLNPYVQVHVSLCLVFGSDDYVSESITVSTRRATAVSFTIHELNRPNATENRMLVLNRGGFQGALFLEQCPRTLQEMKANELVIDRIRVYGSSVTLCYVSVSDLQHEPTLVTDETVKLRYSFSVSDSERSYVSLMGTAIIHNTNPLSAFNSTTYIQNELDDPAAVSLLLRDPHDGLFPRKQYAQVVVYEQNENMDYDTLAAKVQAASWSTLGGGMDHTIRIRFPDRYYNVLQTKDGMVRFRSPYMIAFRIGAYRTPGVLEFSNISFTEVNIGPRPPAEIRLTASEDSVEITDLGKFQRLPKMKIDMDFQNNFVPIIIQVDVPEASKLLVRYNQTSSMIDANASAAQIPDLPKSLYPSLGDLETGESESSLKRFDSCLTFGCNSTFWMRGTLPVIASVLANLEIISLQSIVDPTSLSIRVTIRKVDTQELDNQKESSSVIYVREASVASWNDSVSTLWYNSISITVTLSVFGLILLMSYEIASLMIRLIFKLFNCCHFSNRRRHHVVSVYEEEEEQEDDVRKDEEIKQKKFKKTQYNKNPEIENEKDEDEKNVQV